MKPKSSPPREYPDWHRLVAPRFREEVYNSCADWQFCFNTDWESFLIYAVILHNKDYTVKGGMPHWLEAYITRCEVEPFDFGGKDITITFVKPGWVENTLVFYLQDHTTANGLVYNMASIIKPSEEFLTGRPAPGRAACPQSVWEPCIVRHMERIKNQTDWNPGLVKLLNLYSKG